MKRIWKQGTAERPMPRTLFILILSSLFLISCAGTGQSSRLGTGKPKFASLELEGVAYDLSSGTGYYSPEKPLEITLKMKNISQTVKTFKAEKNRFLILQINNAYGEVLRTVEIPASEYFKGSSFSLAPGEERSFSVSPDTKDHLFAENDRLSCSVRLYFLPKMFRRNTLSIYLDRD